MEKTLVLVDLLGFSQMVNTNEQKARNVLNDFYNISYDEIINIPSVKGHLFSDSLLAYSDSREDLINCIAIIYQKCFLKNNSYDDLSKFFLLPRGAMSEGIVNVEDRKPAPNLTKDFIVSSALVHSAKLESQIKGGRLLVAIKNNEPAQMQYDDNKYELYSNDTLIFLKNYKYKDVLWFSSLDNGENKQDKIIELINIAIKLVKDNARNKEFLVQHIWTLRIGLLSYKRYLKQENDPILNEIMRDFTSDQYWLLWMTLIEMIATRTSGREYVLDENFIDFYKKISLKKGWVDIIQELNKRGNTHTLQYFKKFISEIPIQTRTRTI